MSLKDHKVWPVTVPTASAATLGAAVAQILAHVFPALEPIQEPLTLILVAVFGLVMGWLVPPRPEPEAGTVLVGEHGPEIDLGAEDDRLGD